MTRKAVSGLVLMLLLTGMLTTTFIIQPVKAEPRTSESINISNNHGDSWSPQIVAGADGQLHVVWIDVTGGSREIYYSKWDGTSWSTPTNISNLPGESRAPTIAVDDAGHVHVAWTESDRYYSRSDIYYSKWSHGTWSLPVSLTTNEPHLTGYYPTYPHLAVDSSNSPHLIFTNFVRVSPYTIYADVFYSKWGGTNWTAPVNISNDPSTDDVSSGIAIDGQDNIHAVWWSNRVVYSKFNGIFWSVPIYISGGQSYWADIAVDPNNNPHVVWTQGPNDRVDQEIYYCTIEDGGASWFTPVNISSTTEIGSYGPSIDIDGNGWSQIVWTEQQGWGGNGEIYYRYRGYNAVTQSWFWTVPVNISNTAGQSTSPDIAVSRDDLLHIVWADQTPGNYDILYKLWIPTPTKPFPVYGKGIWIWKIWLTESGSLDTIISRLESARVKWVMIKIGDSNAYWLREGTDFNNWAKSYGGFSGVIKRFHDRGIKVLGAHFIYGRNIYPDFSGVSETDVSKWILGLGGIDGLSVDVEPDSPQNEQWNPNEWPTYKQRLGDYLENIRNAFPNSFIACNSYSRLGDWKTELIALFSAYSDVQMPQTYWAMRPTTPEEEIAEMEKYYGERDDKWSNKPIMPMGQGGIAEFGRDVYAGEIKRFCDILFKRGYLGVSLFSYEIISSERWKEYSECFNNDITFTAQCPVNLVITDPEGLVVNKELNEILGASYMEFDVNGDGNPDDVVTILHQKLGEYSIEVTPEPDAIPTDTYTLEVSGPDATIILAEDVPISDIPTEPYVHSSAALDIPPTTRMDIGEPKFAVDDITYLTSVTLIGFNTEDNPGGSGVASTAYRIYNATYDGGWVPYAQPIYLIGLGDGTYSIDYNSTDNVGNIEATNTAALILDNTAPAITVSNPPAGWALQDGVTFFGSIVDPGSRVLSMSCSIREANDGEGIPIGFEDLPVSYDLNTGEWSFTFDTLLVPDGYYALHIEAEDNLGNEASTTVPYSIRNWAVLELLPASENNKAGRTMPVKFALRVAAAVDPFQPFVYNEDLTIEIFATDKPDEILQESRFGDDSRDYRINSLTEVYITNFKTLRTPKEYQVVVYRKDMLIDSFTFETVK